MGYKGPMRFQTGVIAGFVLGYYFGAKAGHERYEQIERYLEQLRSSGAVQQLVGRLGEVGVTRGRFAVEAVPYRRAPRRVPGYYDYEADPTLN
jgi:hypothetical protein